MIELAAALEATALAQFLKASRWIYPLVNALHVAGVALLVGAIVPMDLRLLRGDAGALWLRRYAAAGLGLAAGAGALLFVTQAQDYVASPWFRAKLVVIAAGLANVALAGRGVPPRHTALASLLLWPAALLLGRMIAYG